MRSIDSYVHANSAEWTRLEDLVRYASKRRSKLTEAELDELLMRYQRVSAQLSYVRTTYAEPTLIARLTRIVAGARAAIYGNQARAGGAIRSFFSSTFPAAVWVCRRQVAVSAAALIIPWVIMAIWLANSPAAVDALAPEALREAYLNEDFEAYYSSAPAAEFSTQVLTNNIRVSFMAFVAGIFYAIPTVLLLAFNGANIGIPTGLFHDAGEAGKFWGLILPHGLLEITAIIVAGGAGMRMGWSLIVPGDRPRGRALVDEAQRSVSIIMGLVLVFTIAGLIEGFVTPSPLPTPARLSIGAAAFLAFWSYILALGPSAVAKGYTGRVTDAPIHVELAEVGAEATGETALNA